MFLSLRTGDKVHYGLIPGFLSMRLSKFFRRYSRVLLMVFMSLLLVVFLVGDVMQSWGRGGGAQSVTLGEAYGKPISSTDRQLAQNKQSMLLQMGFMELQYLDPLDVYLLMEEARRMGVRVGHEQAQEHIARALGAEAAPRLAALQQRYRRSYAQIYDIAGEWMAVLELASAQSLAMSESLPRVELAYRDRNQRAVVELSVIDAKAFLGQVPEPTEEELQAFFEESKDRYTAHTQDEIEFGYLYPDRVRLEVLTVDPQEIATSVRIRPRDVGAYYEQHKAEYKKRVSTPPTSQSSQPVQPPVMVQMTLEEAYESVREDARMAKAIQEGQSLVNEIRQAAYRPWQSVPRGEDGYRTAPPAGATTLAELVQREFANRYKTRIETTDLLGQAALSEQFTPVPDILRAVSMSEPQYREGQVTLTLSELAMRVQGIFTPDKRDTLTVLSVGEPSPVLMQERGMRYARRSDPYQAYVFRVIEAAPSAAPASLDEVRTQVVEDYKLMRAHELAGEYAQRLADLAREQGLISAYNVDTELQDLLMAADQAAQEATPADAENGLPPQRPQYVSSAKPREKQITRYGSVGFGLDTGDKVQRTVFEMGTEQDAVTGPAHDEVVRLDVADALKWVVVQLKEIKPLYENEFALQRSSLVRESVGQQQRAAGIGWIYPANVRQRTHFVSALPGGDEETPEP